MNIWSLCIRRPIMAGVFSLFLLLFGAVGYQNLSVRELPDVDFPVVSIRTAYRGASAEVVDKKVTEEIERQVGSVDGVKSINSVSRDGESVVTVEFHLDREVDSAAQDVRDRVARVKRFLPDEVSEPSVEKFDLNAFAIMWLAMSDKREGVGFEQELILSEIARDHVRPSLEGLPGVGSVMLGGEKKRALRVEVDPGLLASYGVSIADVRAAIARQNEEPPAGRLEGVMREYTLEVEAKPSSPEAFQRLLIGSFGGRFVHLGDVAKVYEGVESERTLARFNGKSAVGLGIVKQSKANTIEVAAAVKKAVQKITLPEHIAMETAFDSSTYVEDSIDEVKSSLVFAGILVLVIIYLFLGRAQITLIPAVVMPISIIATYGCMAFLDFSLNNFTLLALILSIGIVVDDAIVILENSVRHLREKREGTNQRVVERATGEVAVAVLSTSIALMAVFLPVALVEGQIGRFFYEFGVTVCLSIAISTFVALTLTPMLCAHLLKAQHLEAKGLFESGMNRLEQTYQAFLTRIMQFPKTVLALSFGVTGLLSFVFLLLLGKEFMPIGDRGSFVIQIKSPQGASLEYTGEQLASIEKTLSKQDGVASYFGAVALAEGGQGDVASGIVFTRLHSIKEMARLSQEQIIEELRALFKKIPGAEITASGMSPFSRGTSSQPFHLVLSSQDYVLLQRKTEEVRALLQGIEGLVDLQDDLKLNQPQLTLSFDQQRLWEQSVSIPEVASVLNTALSGEKIGDYERDGKRYDLILQAPSYLRGNPEELFDTLQVRGAGRSLMSLSNLVSAKIGAGPSEIKRLDKNRSVSFKGSISKSSQRALGDITSEVEEKLSGLLSDDRVLWKFQGDVEQMQESLGSMAAAFLMGILVIYLVLCAQLESLFEPFIIICSVPFSIVGALFGLWCFGMTLNIYSMIGMIMLIGLVTKNAILLVDYTQTLKKQGLGDLEAVLQGARTRLRPIIMTAVSTLVGILPIALSFGPGAMMRRPLGIAVASGMTFAVLLTLIVIPVLYLFVSRVTVFVNRKTV